MLLAKNVGILWAMRTEVRNQFFKLRAEDHVRFNRILDAIQQENPLLNRTGIFSRMVDLLEQVAPKYVAPPSPVRRPGRPRKVIV